MAVGWAEFCLQTQRLLWGGGVPATNKERALRTRDPRSGGAYVGDGRDNPWRSRAPGAHAHGNAARQVVDGLGTEVYGQLKQSNDPGNNQHNPQYANYWAPLTRKRHIPPHPAQPQRTNHWAPRTRKRHQQEHWPQRPTERSDPTQYAKGRTGDCPGPRKEQQPDGMSHRGGGGGLTPTPLRPGFHSGKLGIRKVRLFQAVFSIVAMSDGKCFYLSLQSLSRPKIRVPPQHLVSTEEKSSRGRN